MKFTHPSTGFALTLAAMFALFAAGGCSQNSTGGKDSLAKAKVKGGLEDTTKGEAGATKHSGWWCEEHGVPEHLCSLCLPEAQAKVKYKDKGDWCKLHDRALSQCFKCDPSKYAKYEAMYEAKYGKKPLRPPEEEFQK